MTNPEEDARMATEEYQEMLAVGMANGIDSIAECWTRPMNDTLHTSIFGVGTVKISDRVKMTMEHIKLS